MKTIIIYAIIMAIVGIRSYLQNKAKQEKMRNEGPNPIPENETDIDDEEEYDPEEDDKTETYKDPLEELKRVIIDIEEQAEAKKQAKMQSLAEEAMQKNLFEEGSSRSQHSKQYEAAPRQPLTEHDMHPEYDVAVADEKGFEMTPEKMREALIYQTIIERPQY